MSPEEAIVAAARGAVGDAPVLLCGSRATGEAAPGSDWDVVVLLARGRVLRAARPLARAAAELERQLGAPVALRPAPAARLRSTDNLFLWKARREGRLLAAPPGYRLPPAEAPALSAAAERSYLLSALLFLLGTVEPEQLAGQLPPAARSGARKALLHIAQLRLLRSGRYAPRLGEALAEAGEARLTEIGAALDRPEAWLALRDAIVAELEGLPPRSSRLGNARYAVLSAVGGRSRWRAAASSRPVEARLASAALLLLRAVGADGGIDEELAARASQALPPSLRPAGPQSWQKLRDRVVSEWPAAHPVLAL